jgi:hypothetical protein
MVEVNEFVVPDFTTSKQIKVRMLDDTMDPLREAKFLVAVNNGEEKEYVTDESGIMMVTAPEGDSGTKLNIKKVHMPAPV